MDGFIIFLFIYGMMGGAQAHLTRWVLGPRERHDLSTEGVVITALFWPIALPLMLGYLAVGKIIRIFGNGPA